MSRYIVNKRINIKANPTQVWEALTSPEKTKKYFFNSKVISDWQVGSKITFKGRMFFIIPFIMEGEITGIEPGRLLQYTLKNGKADDAAAGISKVTDELAFVNGETIVTIKDDVGEGKDAYKRYSRSQKGWDKILAGLKKTVEEDL